MSDTKARATLDLSQGVAASALTDGGMILGRVGDDEVVLARSGAELFAIRAQCSHYRGPLAEGLVVGDTLRCPWHHACFSLRTGEALRAPALDPIACWRVEREADRIFVREKLPQAGPVPASKSARQLPSSIVIVGGGAAGVAAAEMLRRQGYDGPVTLIGADADPPVDRPNLSKDFLAGEAQDDWIPLWPNDFYVEQRIELVLGRRVVSIDPARRTVRLDDGSDRPYGSLLLATGADPVRLTIPGANADQVRYLRAGERGDAAPFFWSQHYDVSIRYVGHAERWDDVFIDGSLEALDCSIEYRRSGRILAVATIGRDRANLEAEVRMDTADREN